LAAAGPARANAAIEAVSSAYMVAMSDFFIENSPTG
jgi:hypothetical protein